MLNQSVPYHDSLSGVIAAALSNALADKTLAENATKAVIAALEAYEDERFLAILQETEEDGRVDMDVIRDALKS